MSRPYAIVEYDPTWASQFEQEVAALKRIFADDALGIEHVGSTAVPGMKGKPQIDLLVLVNDMAKADAHAREMEQAGYTNYDDIHQNGGRLFSREKPDGAKFSNVHIYLQIMNLLSISWLFGITCVPIQMKRGSMAN